MCSSNCTNVRGLLAGEVECFGHTSEDEASEIECLLAEPQTNNGLDDSVMHLNSITTNKSLETEDNSSTVNCTIRNNYYGISDCDAAYRRKQKSNREFICGMMQVVEEEPKPHPVCNFLNVSADYCLDSGFSQSSHLDYASLSGSFIDPLTSDYDIKPMEINITSTENSALPKASLPEFVSNQSSLLLDNMNVNELHDVTPGTNTGVKDKQWLKHHILFGLHNLIEFDNASTFEENGLLDEKEDNMILIPGNYLAENLYSSFTIVPESKGPIADMQMERDSQSVEDVASVTNPDVGRVGLGLAEERSICTKTSKRLCKPTRRYIEEITEIEPRYCDERSETPTICSGQRVFQVRTHSQYGLKKARSTVMVYQETSGGSDMQPTCVQQASKGHTRKHMTSKGNNSRRRKPYNLRSHASRSCPSGSESECEMLDGASSRIEDKSRFQRKHHRQWTLPEVMKLIEGVTQCGVGRWTDIKRLLFSAAAHRTSVDLKDKWRNLLRASGAQFSGRAKIETQKKHMTLPIPQSALRKIRELAVIHPYPRERKSRASFSAIATTGCHSNATSNTQVGECHIVEV